MFNLYLVSLVWKQDSELDEIRVKPTVSSSASLKMQTMISPVCFPSNIRVFTSAIKCFCLFSLCFMF